MSEADDRDWRKSAYLRKDNWPDAIPNSYPKREYGPYPWTETSHDDPHDLDPFNYSHPDAASIGHKYVGDVCPYCGVPLQYEGTVINHNGERGELFEISPDENPVPCYHIDCWQERQAQVHKIENKTLGDYNE